MLWKKKVTAEFAADVFLSTTFDGVQARWPQILATLTELSDELNIQYEADLLQQEYWLAHIAVAMRAIDNLVQEKFRRRVKERIAQKLDEIFVDRYGVRSVTDYENRWNKAVEDEMVTLSPLDAVAGRFCERLGHSSSIRIGEETFISPLLILQISQLLLDESDWWKLFLQKFNLK